MTDYDFEAIVFAKDAVRGTLPEATCGSCGRPMYREQPYPGVATEWRHRSSGHPISWMPTKHVAGTKRVAVHMHRFAVSKTVTVCEVAHCDAEMQPLDKEAISAAAQQRKTKDKTAKEAALQESRERGAAEAHRHMKRAVPF